MYKNLAERGNIIKFKYPFILKNKMEPENRFYKNFRERCLEGGLGSDDCGYSQGIVAEKDFQKTLIGVPYALRHSESE